MNAMLQKRAWYGVPAWWFPVWVTIDADGTALDPLEEAVQGLVGAGVDTALQIVGHLGVHLSLVESAIGQLQERGYVMLDGKRIQRSQPPGAEGSLSPPPEDDGPALHTRRGWVAFDSRLARALPTVWLCDDPPDVTEAPEVPDWSVVPQEPDREPEHGKKGAARRALDGELMTLPHLPGALLLERFGTGVSETDGRRIRRIRERSNERPRVAPIWIPVEHRTHGEVVWRPSLWPTHDIDEELDPDGLDALMPQLSPTQRQTLEASRLEVREAIAPELFTKAGYRNLAELRSNARDIVERRVGAHQVAWKPLVEAAEHAVCMEKVATMVGGGARRVARDWADVLEQLALILERGVASTLGPDSGPVRLPLPDPMRRLLGEKCAKWVSASVGPNKSKDDHHSIEQLAYRIRDQRAGFADRVLALGIAACANQSVASALREATATLPGFMDKLLVAGETRNHLTHPGRIGEVDPVRYRDDVLALCHAAVRMDLPGWSG